MTRGRAAPTRRRCGLALAVRRGWPPRPGCARWRCPTKAATSAWPGRCCARATGWCRRWTACRTSTSRRCSTGSRPRRCRVVRQPRVGGARWRRCSAPAPARVALYRVCPPLGRRAGWPAARCWCWRRSRCSSSAAQFANLDMLVAGCIAATILAVRACRAGCERGRPRGAVRWPLGYAVRRARRARQGPDRRRAAGLVHRGLAAGAAALAADRCGCCGGPACCCFLVVAAPWFVADAAALSGLLALLLRRAALPALRRKAASTTRSRSGSFRPCWRSSACRGPPGCCAVAGAAEAPPDERRRPRRCAC